MNSILITGASSGIGKATAELFHKRGWKVIGTMRHPTEDIPYLCIPLDVTQQKTIDGAAKHQVDVLVNNAGYGLYGAIETCTDEEILKQYDTNVFGLIRVLKAFLPQMRERNNGMIINVASILGKATLPYSGIYCSTKYAVEAISEALWYELYRTNIRVKVIEPGAIQTGFTKGRQFGSLNIPFYRRQSPDSGSESMTDPLVIAEEIYRAATSKGRKFRYPRGKYSTLLLWSKKVLPDWLFMRLVHWYL
jgi:short-subunit dehydrogenase